MNSLLECTKELLRFALAERDAFYDCSTNRDGEFSFPDDKAECDRMDAMIDRAQKVIQECAQ